MHYNLNVESEEGEALVEKYDIGSTYPVFVLTTTDGDVIKRWTGWGGADRFVSTLEGSLADLSGIGERLARFQTQPTFDDAMALANYYAEAGEYLKAADFFREAQKLSPRAGADYSYQIFKNTANAVWNELVPFEQVLPAADAVLASKLANRNNVAKVGQLMARLARKQGRTDQIAVYLEAGLKATTGSSNSKLVDLHDLLKADYALHVKGDTAGALQMRKTSMGANWKLDREKCYNFSKWCLERKINLEEAELCARVTIDLVYPGRYRAMIYNTIAGICEARGNIEEAARMMQAAVEQEPDSEFYSRELDRLRGLLE
ncbi:MAG: hypothetical protein KAU35_01990 [candidate division Zixibacteria bacterium]|nr:hypothetical protein [candidate division Zixibacteria bacterium]